MAKDIVIIQPNEVEPEIVDGMSERNLAGRFNGSEQIGFEHAVLPKGIVADGVVYEGNDELVYVIKGECEIGIKGVKQLVGPGGFFFVPQGEPYDFKVTQGPAEMIAAFSSPRS